MQFNKVTHVLFDLDGLILDSETIYSEAFTSVCAINGKIFTWPHKASVLGFEDSECAEQIIKTLDLQISKEEFMQECKETYEKLFPKVELMPGVQKLVEHLHKCGIPIALSTSSSKENLDMGMQKYQELLSFFHHVVVGSSDPEVRKGKPDPAIFQVCASRFPDKPKPEDCLVFEDSIVGLKAAKAANMQVVLVPDSRIRCKELKDATLLLESLEDFKPELFGLPPFSS